MRQITFYSCSYYHFVHVLADQVHRWTMICEVDTLYNDVCFLWLAGQQELFY